MKAKATLITIFALLVSALAASAAQAATQTFTQDGDITWDDNAVPYPSVLPVSGVTGEVTKVTVGFDDLDNTDETDDLAFMLQGPGGQTVRLMNDAGGEGGAFSASIVFDDDAVSGLPAPLVSATFKPTDNSPGDFMDAPAPPPPYGQFLSTFNGVGANGDWRLFVMDYNFLGNGSLKAWSRNITTADEPAEPLTLDLSAGKQKLGRTLTLGVDASEAGELLFTGKARGSIEVAKGESEVDARLDPGAFKKLKKKVKKGKKASVVVEATLKADGKTAEDDVKVKIKPKKK